jgi:hypothetical protein
LAVAGWAVQPLAGRCIAAPRCSRCAKHFGCEFVGDRTDIRKLAVQCCPLWARLNDRSAPVAGLI